MGAVGQRLPAEEGEIGIGEGEHEEMVEGGAETGVVDLSVCRPRTPIAAMPTPHSSLARILLTSSSPSIPTPSRSPGVTPVQSFFSADFPVAGATNAVRIPGEIGACGSRAGVKVKAGRSWGEVYRKGIKIVNPLLVGRAGRNGSERSSPKVSTEGSSIRESPPQPPSQRSPESFCFF